MVGIFFVVSKKGEPLISGGENGLFGGWGKFMKTPTNPIGGSY
jgi:hypothetical protein